MSITLPTLAVGSVTITYKDGFERKTKTGLVIGTKEGMLDEEQHMQQLAETCDKLNIPIQDVLYCEIEGMFLEPPEGLEELLNCSNDSNLPVTDGLIIETRH